MIICPNCGTEIESPEKKWTYYKFTVESYKCKKCGLSIREYCREGKHSFTLKRVHNKGHTTYVKV